MKELKNTFKITNKLTLGAISLFLVFLVSVILTLTMISHPTDNILDMKQGLTYLAWSQWILLAIGILITGFTTFWWIKQKKYDHDVNQELFAKMDAIYRSQAIIEFNMDGSIITANDKFLELMNYTLEEIQGKHHSMFVDPEYRGSLEYKDFWNKLNRGEYDQAEYKRLGKGGMEVWLQSSYNPILNPQGKPIKVIKVATDVTERKNQDFRLAALTEKLQDIGAHILADSNEISVGINQLEASAISQAASASQQATSVTEISATLEEIKITTQQTLEKAKQLGESASRTSKEGEKGRAAIEQMLDSMKLLQDKMQKISATILSLNDKTLQISEITEAVADIAKQSKMLALNASIEAAKAGESGKGFAVVAGEVKELAEKSQLSTERVQKILQDIQQTAEHAVMVTEEGTKSVDANFHQVQLTGDIISSLGSVIEESSLASLQIVSAVREESVAIEQVDLSVKEINKVTNIFSSATEQTKQAIIGLGKVAESLNNTASIYQSNGEKE